ncbi:hypothetical protein [Pontiella sulfatireligans]|uniref:Uncharacterized protein n=1 Tax=Pontiella sulfatireligans TaxID=2750658 RepID=A0A6C2UI47_9BACT|nr:hypothetical protein [Pontiella sulfatireligans]VGO19892.1 hypothetical protein SCARR_01952 [Pontiella sulfatireligans]
MKIKIVALAVVLSCATMPSAQVVYIDSPDGSGQQAVTDLFNPDYSSKWIKPGEDPQPTLRRNMSEDSEVRVLFPGDYWLNGELIRAHADQGAADGDSIITDKKLTELPALEAAAMSNTDEKTEAVAIQAADAGTLRLGQLTRNELRDWLWMPISKPKTVSYFANGKKKVAQTIVIEPERPSLRALLATVRIPEYVRLEPQPPALTWKDWIKPSVILKQWDHYWTHDTGTTPVTLFMADF